MTVSGTDVSSLAMENLLWLLCVHATKHKWARLSWICDVAELLRSQPQLNWEKVIALGAELAVARPRRILESSTTSSCSSVAVWMNSTTAASSW